MLLKKKVKAGILLYALLMLAVFSLLLQFYLHRQEAESQIAQVAKHEATAYIMAQMVLDQVEEELQERVAIANKVARQTDEMKEDKETASEMARNMEAGEVQETISTKQESTTKSVDTSSTQDVESKPIEDKGTVTFQEGQASYHVKNKQVTIIVALGKGGFYHYQFPVVLALKGE
ncbi:TPA: competence protein ComGG [Streptococcus suis]|uniref:competence type IV pilus minor pilin ComGG n=1 Tax=Streptococcus suis TaxID=1307 RepID=UPI0028C3C0A4|nr:competence type IV pilus minor pilin ComGG [Streptococcus suis]WNO78645.1 competence type IV pilus minor pilin ComGG [Streptococcus suis]WNO82816.1 competence type IV pilus minor pilin ComGG [Streptococcus suis]HEM5198343.1 competence protein ComGG [Streptococcus suis]HEM5250889.1 competence protein ComGG [Streptococcus suis]HEM5313268.1 competence protein ComGG [Streptococcus suis]